MTIDPVPAFIIVDAAVGAILVSLVVGLGAAVARQARQLAQMRERLAVVKAEAMYRETLFNREMAFVWRELQRLEAGRK